MSRDPLSIKLKEGCDGESDMSTRDVIICNFECGRNNKSMPSECDCHEYDRRDVKCTEGIEEAINLGAFQGENQAISEPVPIIVCCNNGLGHDLINCEITPMAKENDVASKPTCKNFANDRKQDVNPFIVPQTLLLHNKSNVTQATSSFIKEIRNFCKLTENYLLMPFYAIVCIMFFVCVKRCCQKIMKCRKKKKTASRAVEQLELIPMQLLTKRDEHGFGPETSTNSPIQIVFNVDAMPATEKVDSLKNSNNEPPEEQKSDNFEELGEKEPILGQSPSRPFTLDV